MAATRARTELAAASAPQQTKDVIPTQEAASADTSSNDQTPARRTTTRTRKLPSRLLPSPSPPPSRPSSLYNAAKQAKGSKEEGFNGSPVGTPPATSLAAAPKLRKASKTDSDAVSSDPDAAVEKEDSEDLGPGKRKRRPSSMYKPPTTLTTVETPSPASLSSASKSKKKGRSLSPEASAHKSQSPSAMVAQAKLKGRLAKRRLEEVTPSSKKGGNQSKEVNGRRNGDDSEAEFEVATAGASKRPRLSDADDSLDLSPPPLLPRDGSVRVRMPTQFTQPTFIRGGHVSVSPEASAKRPIKFGVRDIGRPALPGDQADVGRTRIGDFARSSKYDTPYGWKGRDVPSSSPISNDVAKFDIDPSTPLTYIPFRCAARNASGYRNMQPTPFTAQIVDEDEEDEEEDDDDDDENDFHQAMLDADFDFFDSQKTDPNVEKPLWSAARRATTEEDTEMEDTPATTPRSPPSGCDLPSPYSPRCKTEEDVSLPSSEEKATSLFGAGRDSVFVHALPTTQVGADKPHQHAGSLTLSLPYSPIAASSPQLKAIDTEIDAAAPAKRNKDAPTGTQMGTPVLQRRKHAGLPSGPHGLAPLKLSADLMERSNSNVAPYMQLSPMIEIESPLLSPGLSLSLHSKGTDLPSPFIMGVGSLPDLEQPAPLDLACAEVSTTPKASSPELQPSNEVKPDFVVAAPLGKEAKIEATMEGAPSAELETKTVEAPKEATKTEKLAARRPALPPPRQIRFTTFTTPSVDSTETKPQQPESIKTSTTAPPVQPQQQQTSQHQSNPGASTGPEANTTPDLVHGGSSSPDSASDSPSPATSADAEVETILFGPPEKLDLHELDHAWGGSKAAQHQAAIRRVKATRIHHADLTANSSTAATE